MTRGWPIPNTMYHCRCTSELGRIPRLFSTYPYVLLRGTTSRYDRRDCRFIFLARKIAFLTILNPLKINSPLSLNHFPREILHYRHILYISKCDTSRKEGIHPPKRSPRSTLFLPPHHKASPTAVVVAKPSQSGQCFCREFVEFLNKEDRRKARNIFNPKPHLLKTQLNLIYVIKKNPAFFGTPVGAGGGGPF